MKVVGVIIESNPLHNGHKYLVDKIKQELNPDILIALSSGYFTMRGEISLLNKKNKTKLLLDLGFDIVIDSPLYLLLNSSEYFANNAVNILNTAKISHLAFGIEDSNLTNLHKLVNLFHSSNFQTILNNELSNKIGYKLALQNALFKSQTFTQDEITSLLKSNNTLAIGYLKSLQNFPHIIPYAVERYGSDEESNDLSNFPSGSAIRNAYFQKINISPFLPYSAEYLSNISDYNNQMSIIFNTLYLKNDTCSNYLHVSEGIDNYIFNNYANLTSFTDNINLLANKKYSKSRIRRTILSMILQLPKDIPNKFNNIRILGFNKNGEKYLKNIKDNIILKIKQTNNPIWIFELKASKLYDIITKENNNYEEYKFPLKGE